jgi:hypothetical protein
MKVGTDFGTKQELDVERLKRIREVIGRTLSWPSRQPDLDGR